MNNKNDHTAAAGDELTLRAADPAVQTRDMQSRTMTLRAATLDESARSVEVTMCTENPTTVYAPGYGIIDEVLVADGAEFPAQLPLLEVHNRYSLDAVLGSVRNIRRDGATWVGRAFFAEGNERADTAWNMVRQGHLTAVSLGYLQTAGVEIPRGQTNNIAGRSFTAGTQRSLLVTTRYAAKECSLVPVGADKATTVRGEAEAPPITAGATRTEHPMDPLLRTFLVSLGLRADATLEQAQAFHGELAGNFKTRADAIVAKTMTLEQATAQSKVEIDAVRSIIRGPDRPGVAGRGGGLDDRAGRRRVPAAPARRPLAERRRAPAAARPPRAASSPTTSATAPSGRSAWRWRCGPTSTSSSGPSASGSPRPSGRTSPSRPTATTT
jgi:hypothetical protein